MFDNLEYFALLFNIFLFNSDICEKEKSSKHFFLKIEKRNILKSIRHVSSHRVCSFCFITI